MIKGSCLCGAVRYEIRGEIGRIVNCHCSMCRKAHGAGFGSWSQVKSADFTSLQYIDLPKPERFFLAVGTLDDDPGVRPAMHIFTGSKAPWLDIADRLPQHEDWP
jgi:hypothetical protein